MHLEQSKTALCLALNSFRVVIGTLLHLFSAGTMQELALGLDKVEQATKKITTCFVICKFIYTFVGIYILQIMKERLIRLMQAEGLTAAKLADITNVQPSTVSHIVAGRNNPRYDFLAAILTSFPKVNSRWLMLGEGSMYENSGDTFATKEDVPMAKKMDKDPELQLESVTSRETERLEPVEIPENGVSELQRKIDLESAAKRSEILLPEPKLHTNSEISIHTEVNAVPEPIPMSNIPESVMAKHVAKIVIFNTNGTFEIYQN